MRIAILGASGQVGRVIFGKLNSHYQGWKVTAVSRKSLEGFPKNQTLVFDPFKDSWKKLGKTDVLINCIGIDEETPEMSFEKAHQELTGLIIKNRAEIGNPRIIQISVNGADPESNLPYFSSKGKADEELMKQPNAIVVRPSMVCTPNSDMVRKLKSLRKFSRYFLGMLPVPENVLNTKVQPVSGNDLSDLVEALCWIPIHPLKVVAVGPEEISFKEIFSFFKKGKPKLVPFSKKTVDKAYKFISPMISGLVSKEQYQVLSQPSTGDQIDMEDILGRKLDSTKEFWLDELNKK